MAYQVKVHQIIGPARLGSQSFDIAAKLPEASQQSQVPHMLHALLSDRFGMKMHHEQRDFPVYALENCKDRPEDLAGTTGG